ncbi:MAG: formylmethanofuran dehydrogenase subunit B [Planctomycetaceae bacterium]
MSSTHTDVACTVCGCVCDDLEVQIANGRIAGLRGACRLSEPWFLGLNDSHPAVAAIGGEAVPLNDAIDRSVAILEASRNPLIFGLSRSSTDGQRAAVALAERLRANIDTTASVCHGPSIMAIQQVGESTCSLGEVRNRADLVIFWGANPEESHPRHLERYSGDATGWLLPRGRSDRKVVVIDAKPTATSALADHFFQIDRGGDFELIWSLRKLLQGRGSASGCAGLSADQVQQLSKLMTSCTYGVVFFGLGLAQRGLGHLNVEALLKLVAELNDHTRFCARRLRIPGDVTGADSVLCWQTGYPFAVNFSRGYPRYNPGEFTANPLLERNEVDACLFVGSESASLLSPVAVEHLNGIPTIALDYPNMPPRFVPTVQFTTAVYGVHQEGTAYRMDEMPIPLRKLLDSEYPTDESILSRILSRLPAERDGQSPVLSPKSRSEARS